MTRNLIHCGSAIKLQIWVAVPFELTTHHYFNLGEVGEISRNLHCFAVLAFDFRLYGGQRPRISAMHLHPGAFPCKQPGDRHVDAARTTSY